MINHTRSHRYLLGATLAEGLVVMMISTLFMSVLPGFHLTYVKIWRRESAKLGAVESADFALRRIQDDVRNARRAIVSSDGSAVTLVQPLRAYDSELGREVNVLDSQDCLQDGDLIQYYLVQEAASGTGRTLYRRVVRVTGSVDDPRLVAYRVYPTLNLLAEDGTTQPLFNYEADLHTLTMTITTAEPKPNTGTYAPTNLTVECSRDHGQLYRVASESEPEGEIRCIICGDKVNATAEIVTYQTQITLRNE